MGNKNNSYIILRKDSKESAIKIIKRIQIRKQLQGI